VKRTDSTGGWGQDLRLNTILQTTLDKGSQLISNINNSSDVRMSQFNELMFLNDEMKEDILEVLIIMVRCL